jgi:hypothetical protein
MGDITDITFEHTSHNLPLKKCVSLLVAITTFFAFVALQGSAYQLAGCPCIWQKRCESEESYICWSWLPALEHGKIEENTAVFSAVGEIRELEALSNMMFSPGFMATKV